MAYIVIKKFYKDKAGRLMLLVEGKLTDTNFRIDRKENRYSICLEEHNIRALYGVYESFIAPDNRQKLIKYKNFIKGIGKRKQFYVV